jgi:hypothetical protein
MVTDADERGLLRTYRALLAGRAIPGGKAIESPVGEPFLVAAARALAEGRGTDAVALGTRALAALDAWGIAWDKRLGLLRWRELAEWIVRDGHTVGEELDAAKRRMQRALDGAGRSPARLWATLEVLRAKGPTSCEGSSRGGPPLEQDRNAEQAWQAEGLTSCEGLPPRFAAYIQGLRANAERPMLQFYPGLRVQPWHDPQLFPVVRDLERSHSEIAREARAFDMARFQDEAENIDRTGRWGVLFLLEMGRKNEENLARCPTLRSILERHRTLTTHAGLMYFSCLDPHTKVTPHRGPTNVRLRCHLGLDIPPECGIRVGGITRRWEEGKCLVLDDSFLHDVWNDSDRRRLVLVLDLWHPDLDEDEVALLAGLHRYGAANALGAKRYWANNDEALRRAREGGKDAGSTTALGNEISAALRSGELGRAGEVAARYAALCRGTRFYPTPRADDPPLPPEVSWPRTLSPGKLTHDVEQLEYLRDRGVLTSELPPIIRRYAELRDRLRPLGDEARVPLNGAAEAQIGHVYNRLIHVRDTPRVPQALARDWTPAAVEDQYLSSKPNVVVVDGFLSPDAAESLRLFCLESTVWSTNRYDHGRLGSFFRDGFSCPLLTQIAEELRSAFPRVIGARHPVTQIWGYKYASVQPPLTPHADFAAVNVNFWLTPDDANLEPESGGLVLYDVAAPKDWDFATYNRNGARINELLASTNATPMYIPYRCNRAVIFDSDLFHATPALRFRAGYENRRVNVTVLFGDRLRA